MGQVDLHVGASRFARGDKPICTWGQADLCANPICGLTAETSGKPMEQTDLHANAQYFAAPSHGFDA